MSVRHRPARRAAGQHFLRSSRLAEALVAGAGIRPGDLVVEVGGGTGMLTRPLVRTGARTVVVERDPGLADALRSSLGDTPSVRVVCADALRYAWPAEPFAVVANLPFARSGAILDCLLDPAFPLRRADVIVQWELARKHAAVWPATLRSVLWRAWYELALVRRLDRGAFAPVPAVDAGVLRVERRPVPRVPPERRAAYAAFVRAAYGDRRPLRRALGPALSPRQVKRLAPVLGFDPDVRPAALDAAQWAGLFAFATGASRRG